MSATISISLSQSSNFVLWYTSYVEMSWSKDVVMFICHCVAFKVSVYFCTSVCRGSSIGLEGGQNWSVMASCCSLLVRSANSSMCMGGLAVGSISWVAGSVPANPLDLFDGQGPCCTQQLFHHLVLVWCWWVVYFPVEQCHGDGVFPVSSYMTVWFPYLIVMLWVLWHFL